MSTYFRVEVIKIGKWWWMKKKKLNIAFFFLFLLFCLLFTLCNFVVNFFELNFLSYLRTCNQSTLLIYQSVSRKTSLSFIYEETIQVHSTYITGFSNFFVKIVDFLYERLFPLYRHCVLVVFLKIWTKVTFLRGTLWYISSVDLFTST